MPTEPKVVAIIPARWDSSRFPGKPLKKIRGKPMVQWVVEKTRQAQKVSEVLVATDDRRIFDAVSKFGGQAVMTSRDHASGTDRIAEVAAGISCDIVVNVQGDEPLISPGNIDLVVQPLAQDASVQVSTLMIRIQEVDEIFNPNVVKVVTNCAGFALYFSRAPIPFCRDRRRSADSKERIDTTDLMEIQMFKHIGLYAFSKSFLMQFPSLPSPHLETTEKLEQLRILYNNVPIKVTETREDSMGVDCVEDLEKVEQRMNDCESD